MHMCGPPISGQKSPYCETNWDTVLKKSMQLLHASHSALQLFSIHQTHSHFSMCSPFKTVTDAVNHSRCKQLRSCFKFVPIRGFQSSIKKAHGYQVLKTECCPIIATMQALEPLPVNLPFHMDEHPS